MTDAPTIAVLVGSAIQAAPAAVRVASVLVDALRAMPLPPADTDLDRLIASID